MARSSLGLVCAMALAVSCSARRSNQGWGWGGKAEDKLQTEDPKPEDPKPGWVDWAAVAEKAKATGMSMKDAAVGMGVYAKETAEDIPWNDIAEQAKQYGDTVKDAASKVEWEKWAAQAKQYGDNVKDAASKVEWDKWAAKASEWGEYAAGLGGGLDGPEQPQPEGGRGNPGGSGHADTFPTQAKPSQNANPGFPGFGGGKQGNAAGFGMDMNAGTDFGGNPNPAFGGGAGGFGFPDTQGDASAGGMLPGFDMGNVQDRMNNMMADAMNCMQKQTEVSCKDAELRKNVDVPLWYCLVAIGERDAGPMPPCEGAPVKFGDASKCKQSEEEIRQAMHEAKEMCFSKLQELYDLQMELGKCAASITETKKEVEEDRQPLQHIQQEAEECEKAKAKKESEESLGLGLSSEKEGSHEFCPAYISELEAGLKDYTLAVGNCISVQVSASVKIPEINIEVPEIKVGQVHEGSFDVQIPNFEAPDFTGDIVVPGGGGKLNVAVSHEGQTQGHAQGHAEEPQEAKLTFDQRVANIKSDIKSCEEAKTKVVKTKEEVAGMKTDIVQQKEKACKEAGSLLQTGTSPEASVAIQVFTSMKMIWRCSAVATAIDVIIKILEKC